VCERKRCLYLLAYNLVDRKCQSRWWFLLFSCRTASQRCFIPGLRNSPLWTDIHLWCALVFLMSISDNLASSLSTFDHGPLFSCANITPAFCCKHLISATEPDADWSLKVIFSFCRRLLEEQATKTNKQCIACIHRPVGSTGCNPIFQPNCYHHGRGVRPELANASQRNTAVGTCKRYGPLYVDRTTYSPCLVREAWWVSICVSCMFYHYITKREQ